MIAILLQHAEEAAVLWGRRDYAVRAPHYDLKDLETHDGRLAAHLDGLVIGAEAAADVLWTQFDQFPDAGEAFAAAFHALASAGRGRFEEVVDRAVAADAERDPTEFMPPPEDRGGAGGTGGALRGVASALGWAEPGLLGGLVADLLASEDAARRTLGIAACALHRRDPGAALAAACEADDPGLAARALQAAGELGRADLGEICSARTKEDDPRVAAAAAYAAALLKADGGAALWRLVFRNGSFAAKAAAAAPRLCSEKTARDQLRTLKEAAAAEPALARRLVQAVGAFGDPVFFPWLLERCAEPALARVAGEAIARTTGIDLAYDDLDRDPPADFEGGPTDDPADDDVAPDPDADRPWPDPERLAGRIAVFTPPAAGRLLHGAPVSEAASALVSAPQRTRLAAAFEGAAARGGALFPCAAPAGRQRALLASQESG